MEGGGSIRGVFRNGARATGVMAEAEVVKKVQLKMNRRKCGAEVTDTKKSSKG